MAEIIIKQRVDDLDEKPIDQAEDVGVTYIGLNGVWWAIDLRQSNFDKLEKALTGFTDKARKPRPEELVALNKSRAAGGKTVSASGKNTGGSGMSKAERAALRAWALEQDEFKNKIPERGRYPLDVVEAYEKAKAAGKA